MRIAMIGTRGVPARYGGFETAVEEIGSRLADRGHDVIAYCRNPGQRQTGYKGMRLVNLPAIRARSAETLSHSALSAAHAIVRGRPDVAFVFNPSNSPVIPALQAARIPVAVNMDGLESHRAKWGGAARRYIAWAERASARQANAVIADSRVIQAHLERTFAIQAHFIPYGIPEVRADLGRLGELGLEDGGYLLVVARWEPENQVDVVVRAYREVRTDLPLVVVGGATYSSGYDRLVTRLCAEDPRVRLLGPVYDQRLLVALYAGTRFYIHGHSVGGTNPSLLRAMGAGVPILAFDSPFNREVLEDTGQRFWRGEEGLRKAAMSFFASVSSSESAVLVLQKPCYAWDFVASEYERLAVRLVARTADRQLVAPVPRGMPRMSEPGATVASVQGPHASGE